MKNAKVLPQPPGFAKNVRLVQWVYELSMAKSNRCISEHKYWQAVFKSDKSINNLKAEKKSCNNGNHVIIR